MIYNIIQSLRAFRRATPFATWSGCSGLGPWKFEDCTSCMGHPRPPHTFVEFGESVPTLGVPGGALGVPGGALGVLGGALGVLSTTAEVSARACRRTLPFERLLGGSLGAPWGVLGGPWGVPGRSQATFWAPRSDPDDKGAHPGGSLGGSRRVEKSPESIFLRSREAKYMYFQGFEHAHFVDLMWPLGAPGRPWEDFDRLRGLQGWSWGGPGGSREEIIRPQVAPGGSRAKGFRPQVAPGGLPKSQIGASER